MNRFVRATAGSIGTALAVAAVLAATPGSALAAAGGKPGIGAGPATAVPASFRATSLTWTSPQDGWVLGTARCGTKTCTDVIGTSDAGKTWKLVGTIHRRSRRSATLAMASPRSGSAPLSSAGHTSPACTAPMTDRCSEDSTGFLTQKARLEGRVVFVPVRAGQGGGMRVAVDASPSFSDRGDGRRKDITHLLTRACRNSDIGLQCQCH